MRPSQTWFAKVKKKSWSILVVNTFCYSTIKFVSTQTSTGKGLSSKKAIYSGYRLTLSLEQPRLSKFPRPIFSFKTRASI